MRVRLSGIGGRVLLCAWALVACDDKKAPDATPPATAAAAPTAAPEPTPKEVQPVEEEAPVKKPPRVCTASKTVDFAGNAALEAQVRLQLAKPEGDIAVADLPKIKSINLSQTKVDELDPCIFPHLTGLKDLFLGAGKLSDLGPLANLRNLESLRASLNKVEDLKPLAQLVKMDRLDLGHTMVKDLTPLAGLTTMSELELDDTPVTDVSPLATCVKLERLSIQRTEVKNVAALLPLTSLKFLYTTGAPIEDKFALAPLVRGHALKIVDQ